MAFIVEMNRILIGFDLREVNRWLRWPPTDADFETTVSFCGGSESENRGRIDFWNRSREEV